MTVTFPSFCALGFLLTFLRRDLTSTKSRLPLKGNHMRRKSPSSPFPWIKCALDTRVIAEDNLTKGNLEWRILWGGSPPGWDEYYSQWSSRHREVTSGDRQEWARVPVDLTQPLEIILLKQNWTTWSEWWWPFRKQNSRSSSRIVRLSVMIAIFVKLRDFRMILDHFVDLSAPMLTWKMFLHNYSEGTHDQTFGQTSGLIYQNLATSS